MIKLTITQDGLSPGNENESRSDGLNTGGLVTVTHTGTGTIVFTLLWVPEDDTTALSSFSQIGNTATFSPDPNSVGGTYRIQAVLTDVSGVHTLVRLFAIRTANARLRIPALNERADPTGSLRNKGSEVIDASEFNEPSTSGPFAQGNYGGWYSAYLELVKKVEELLNA